MRYNSHLKALFDGYIGGHGFGENDEHIALLFGCSKFPPILYSVHSPAKIKCNITFMSEFFIKKLLFTA